MRGTAQAQEGPGRQKPGLLTIDSGLGLAFLIQNLSVWMQAKLKCTRTHTLFKGIHKIICILALWVVSVGVVIVLNCAIMFVYFFQFLLEYINCV